MSDRSSGFEDSMSQSIAIEAQRMVREAAQPVPAGETVKGQLRRAAHALGYRAGDWRIRAAWYSEAGVWSAHALEELRARYETWKSKQERKTTMETQNAAAQFLAIAARLEAQDADFYRADVATLRDLAGRNSDGNDRGMK